MATAARIGRWIGNRGAGRWPAPVCIALLLAALTTGPGANAGEHNGIPAGFTADGAPYLGSPDAPVTIEEWSDYQCPFCGRHFRETVPALLEKYVRPGKVRLVYRDFPLESLHPTSIAGHVAARCVGRQGADRYWAMHDALFERQAEWTRLPDPDPFLAGLVAGTGADPAAVLACIAEDEARGEVAASVAEAGARSYVSTPTFRFRRAADQRTNDLMGAYPVERFDKILTALLAGDDPPEEEAPKPAELPPWAKPEGQAPDPDRPGYTLAGDAYKGSADAPVTVVEFGDFQCPACARHALEVQPRIDAALVTTGQVRWISKHLPLKVHPQAALAAAAAECAGEQGKYWEIHHALYERQAEWATATAATVLPRIARDTGLDGAAFDRCFAGRGALERVLTDLYDAQGIVERTPSFVILPGDGTGSVSGGMPADGFIKFLGELIQGQEPAPVK